MLRPWWAPRAMDLSALVGAEVFSLVSAGSIRGIQAEADRRDSSLNMEQVSQMLSRNLPDSVEIWRSQCCRFANRGIGIHGAFAVDRRRTCKHDSLYGVPQVANRLQKIHRSAHIDLEPLPGIRITGRTLQGSKMNDVGGLNPGNQLTRCGRIAQVDFSELNPLVKSLAKPDLQCLRPGRSRGDCHAADRLLEQLVNCAGPDTASSARNQYVHFVTRGF